MASPVLSHVDPPALSIEPGRQPAIARRLPWIVFAAAAILLMANAGPGVWFHDSGEFAMAAAVGGVPNPPGAPTWTLPAWLAAQALPFLDPARAANLLCALYAAASLGLLTHLFRHERPASGLAVSCVPALALCGVPAFLEQAFFTEQYTQLLMLNLAILAVAPRDSGRGWRWAAAGLLCGLAVGNHLSQLVLAPLMIALALRPGRSGAWKRIGLGLAGFAAGLTVFAYGPIRSAAHPILDWGRQSEGDGFLWSILRRQWETRPISEAPPGFTLEWLASYALPDQLGWLGLGLALAGAAALMRGSKGGSLILHLALAAVPYSFILWLGHLRQVGMDLIYIRHYGVADWHLPVYALGAALAGLGAAWASEKIWPAARRWAGPAIALAAALWAGWQVSQNSGYGQDAASRFAADLFAGVPEDAMVVLGSDNPAGVATYERHVRGVRPDLFVASGDLLKDGLSEDGFQWSQDIRRGYYENGLRARERQPMRLPDEPVESLMGRTLVTEYPPRTPGAGAYMVPAGLLFVMRDEPVSQAEAIRAYKDNVNAHPDLFQGPKGRRVARLEAEAYGNIHQARGRWLLERRMPLDAVAAFRLALEWQPDNAQTWYALGFAYDMAGETLPAADAYETCHRLMPRYPGAARALAITFIELGLPEEAKPLLRSALENGDQAAAEILKSLEADH
jgi:hypothetical protein